HPAVGRAACKSRQCHGTSELRHVGVVHQPDACPDRALDQSGQIREEGLYAAQATRRKGRTAASRQDRRQAHPAEREAVELYRRAGGGTLQTGSLPILTGLVVAFTAIEICSTAAVRPRWRSGSPARQFPEKCGKCPPRCAGPEG